MAIQPANSRLSPSYLGAKVLDIEAGCVASLAVDSPTGPEVLNIRQARENLPSIVNSVAGESVKGVAIGRRGQPAAVVVGYEWISPLLARGEKKQKLALLIVDELLPDAPLHLKLPAVVELARLPIKDLNVLWRLDCLPQTKKEIAGLESRLAHPRVVARLVQRSRVAAAIRKAREAGLFEAAEDATSEVTGGLLEDIE
jgi:hypothetical protein